MPINYKEYHPKWTLIVRLIRKRSGDCCEKCGVPNKAVIARDGDEWYIYGDSEVQKWGWSRIKEENKKRLEPYHLPKITKIVLTTAHIDQDKTNNKFDNLGHWCQMCHLGHDRGQHTRNLKYGRNHKRDQLIIEFK